MRKRAALEIEHEVREEIARRLEERGGNYLYRRAWKAAAKHVRGMEMLTGNRKKLTDKPEQISNG